MNEEKFKKLLQKTNNNTAFVLTMVDKDITLLDREEQRTKYKLIHYACLFNNFDLVKGLVKRGCNINTKDCNDMDPLYWAVQGHMQNFKIIFFLLSVGANPCTNCTLWTALGWASIYADLEICKLLIFHGANLLEKMEGTVGNIPRNSTALELYGEFYGINHDDKQKACNQLRLEWDNQIKRKIWDRRGPFVEVAVSHGYRPLKYRLKSLLDAALLPFDSIPPVDVSTSEKHLAFLRSSVFSIDGIFRLIISFL
jgi:hypothetical protein